MADDQATKPVARNLLIGELIVIGGLAVVVHGGADRGHRAL